jgi:hypothetical protein
VIPTQLKPAPGEGRGIRRGFLLNLFLHVGAAIVVGIIGSRLEPGGELIVVPFLALLGITQWFYIGPAAWLLRRRGSNAAAKGVLLAGSLVTAANVLFYSVVFLVSLVNVAEVRRIQQYEREHPSDKISTDGVVTVVDDKHFEFQREDDGTVVSLLTWEGLEYIFLKKDGGYEIKTRDILKPGVRVAIEYYQERGKPPLSATMVRVYEEGATRN